MALSLTQFKEKVNTITGTKPSDEDYEVVQLYLGFFIELIARYAGVKEGEIFSVVSENAAVLIVSEKIKALKNEDRISAEMGSATSFSKTEGDMSLSLSFSSRNNDSKSNILRLTKDDLLFLGLRDGKSWKTGTTKFYN